jgi:D-tyrosyl-tRNA(Tyr) deacylase
MMIFRSQDRDSRAHKCRTATIPVAPGSDVAIADNEFQTFEAVINSRHRVNAVSPAFGVFVQGHIGAMSMGGVSWAI